jgi:hypothetical protein
MKKFIVILFFLLLSINANSQTILERLDSPDYSVRLEALIEIRDNNLREYSTDLLDRIFQQPMLSLSYFFIDVLFKLEYWDIVDQLYQFIDICDDFPQEQPLYHKVKATEILVKLDDLSTLDYFFEYVNLDPLENSVRFLSLLKELAIRVGPNSEYSSLIRDLLMNIKDNSEHYSDRRRALEYLILVWGENNLKDEILSTITNDQNSNMRKFAMEHYNFPDRKDLLQQQIQNDNHRYRRINYAQIFLKNYVKPEDIKFIKDYLLIEPDETARISIDNLVYLFIPTKYENMDHLDWAKDLSEDLDKLYDYLWMEGPNYIYYKESLDYLLVLLKEENHDSCNLLNEIKENADNDVDSEQISGEAYAYILYKATYIQETLPWSCD